ncbi:MAG: class I SAM-dependent methyltransferase [Solirubrobacterales bacterium]
MHIKQGHWTPESTDAFWQYIGQREDLHGDYFTRQVGYGLTEFIGHTGRLRPGTTVMDYGCGPGFLIEYLLSRRVECHAADLSTKAVELANRKYAGNLCWKGASVLSATESLLPAAHFDVVTCIETLEHLPDDSLQRVVREIFGYLKPGGIGVFSTPFDEDLKHSSVFCPFCHTEYHKVQHQRSFNAAQLSSLLQSQGFTVLFCRDLDFREFQRIRPGWKDMSLRALAWLIRKKWKQWTDRISAKPFPYGRTFNHQLRPGPHLCAIAERPMEVRC